MRIGIPKETEPDETRVALTPEATTRYVKLGAEVSIEKGLGESCHFTDSAYVDAGAELADSRDQLLGTSELILRVQKPELAEVAKLEKGTIQVSYLDPFNDRELVEALCKAEVTAISMEMVPRTTRAQKMDALSSQHSLAGYYMVVLAAERLDKILPMMTTPSGTIQPARVFVIGAGVAGLQAIATAKRLGAVVEAYDTRAAAAEQVESLGAKFVVLELDAGDAEDAGGYAREQTEEFYAAQRKLMAEKAATSDVVITTALVPGRRAPLLLDEEGVRGMAPGSVIVDMAAANGGNCAGTQPGEAVVIGGVHVLGPLNLAGELPTNASQMFSKNAVTFLQNLLKDGALAIDLEDEIVAGSLVAKDGAVVHPVVLEKLEGGR